MARSKLEVLFEEAWKQHGLKGSDMEAEFRFDPDSKWRFDFAWPGRKIAVEIQGFGFGHQRIAAQKRDAEKMRKAIELGWTVIPFTSGCLGSKAKREEAVELVSKLLCDL